MNYLDIKSYDIANGAGIRVSLWVSGCDMRCPGCHNPESWDFKAGKLFTEKEMNKIITDLNKPYIQGFTITGGHPLAYDNLPQVYDILKEIRTQLPKKDIWLYTGYTLEENDFDNTADIGWDNALLRNAILNMCDVVVDGPYIEAERDITLPWCGSRNQRVIDVKKTIEANKIVLFDS